MSNQRRNGRRRSTLLGAALVAVFAAALFVALNAANGLPDSSGTVVKAAFSDVSGLLPGNDVRVAGTRVGRVTAIDLRAGHPVVTLELDDHRPVYRDASATIADQSPLGEKYVELSPGDASSGTMAAKDTIAESRTSPSQNLADLLQVLDGPTREALGSTLRQVGGGTATHAQDLHAAGAALPAALPDLGTISRALSANSGADTTQLLHAADNLAGSFAGRQQQIAALLGNLNTTLAALDVNNGKPLAESIGQAPTALSNTRNALHSLQAPLVNAREALTTLQPGATALGKATPDLRGVLRGSVRPMQRLTGVADQAVPAVESLTTTLRDARPLAPQLGQALRTATHPLAVIAPYAQDISLFFTYFSDAMKDGDDAGHWLRIYPPIDAQSAAGLLPIQDPTASHDAYAPPGVAYKEKKTTLLGGQQGGGQ
ncbi:MlaD family protein [Streptomyces sp. RB6PN25]|uniref:MlaD family protein n=1 Tax=Streptomyces humicola TaxID=2953240 RepID=A0ABT1PQ09_9ACTN|nr:MlaD family protein [Streptomyces humicola]MCQ4079208.1 MlaD family protein [Streptomyces humicola]